MRAAIRRDRRLVVDEMADPTPGPGEVLVKTFANPDAHAKIIIEPWR